MFDKQTIVASPGRGYEQNGKIHRIWHLNNPWNGHTFLDLAIDPARRANGVVKTVVEVWAGEKRVMRLDADSYEVALAELGIKVVPFGRVSRPRRKKQIPSMQPLDGSAIPPASAEDIQITRHNMTQQYRLNQEIIRYLTNPQVSTLKAEYILMRTKELLADMPFWQEDLGASYENEGGEGNWGNGEAI
ncbi:hypothetical protein [Kocuria sabuli]|uniref:hypothetical protein n=1 Tax=Kocuria sabuli TaxID=3071448 RepID=UPI0034D65681